MRFQLVQESAPTSRFDAWGQIEASYEPGELNHHFVARAIKALESRTTLLPWSDLENDFDPSQLRAIEGDGITENMTTGALLVDSKLYTLPCKTRFGDYPFCSELRHGVYSVSKSAGALVSMLRLAQKYGDEVFDERILDYLPISASHDGWDRVTFGDTLNMATGIGDDEPRRVSSYVDEDESESAWHIGLPTGWRYDDGQIATYHMSLWQTRFSSRSGCVVPVAHMSGYGGNYVVLMPNGVTGFRFADGRDGERGT